MALHDGGIARTGHGFLSAGRIVSAVRGGSSGDGRPTAGRRVDRHADAPGRVALLRPRRRAVSNGHDFVAQALEKGAWGRLSRRRRRPGSPTLPASSSRCPTRLRLSGPCVGSPSAVRHSRGRRDGDERKDDDQRDAGGDPRADAPGPQNPGNLNNHIGVPLTLLGLRSAHRAAVIEMGMSGAGEIRRLCEIARPTVRDDHERGPRAHEEARDGRRGRAREGGAVGDAPAGRDRRFERR